ncbi:SDR family oxidoreductase [Allopusillimonas soli]|uniref:SDR family oxidoreductase n=1 Tax=Allopusillimonas soli TaxID=659016 RepID=A0A853F5J1_9BURK|nr:SDR family oxidoreductase [Allopusillimonas soli]NYT35794.1 SDR family oxidoreductase [Allopusillimonas soli]TEA76170.1 SDR family oxidoreductase [Allopusillimonas soli]
MKDAAVVTGGASGIGEACAQRFAALGHAVAILDVEDDKGTAAAARINDEGGHARFYSCDVADADAVNEAAERIAQDMGPAAVLVTSAALIPDTEAILDMDMARHERMWQVNYHGTLHACIAFGRQMREMQRGAIVTLGSINSMMPLPLPAYNPGKVAIARLTQLLAVELGQHGVRVNSVAPTYVMTEGLQDKIASGLRDAGKIMAPHALATLPNAVDIADAVAFLCSDQAACITGVLLPVDAGWAAGVSYKSYAGGVPWDPPS